MLSLKSFSQTMRFLINAFFVLCSLPIAAEEFKFPNFDGFYNGVAYGYGVDPNAVDPNDLRKAQAITFTVAPVSFQEGHFEYSVEEIKSTEDVFSSRSRSAGMSARYLAYKGEASYESRVASRKRSDSTMWRVKANKDYGVREQLTNVKLTPTAEQFLKDRGYSEFVRNYGSRFISTASRSASITVTFEAYDLSQEDEQYVTASISVSASFVKGEASAKAKMSDYLHKLSTTAKTRVEMTADGIGVGAFFASDDFANSLDVLQSAVQRLLQQIENAKGNVSEYYTTAYADVIPGTLPPLSAIEFPELDKAQRAFELAYSGILQIDDFKNGRRAKLLDSYELDYLAKKRIEFVSRRDEVQKWLNNFKQDDSLRALDWPAIELELPEITWYAALPIEQSWVPPGLGPVHNWVMRVYVSGGSEIGSVKWQRTDRIPWGGYASIIDLEWPSAYFIQQLDTPQKLDQIRKKNGSLQRWYEFSESWTLDSEFPSHKYSFEAILADKDGNRITSAKDRYARYLLPTLKPDMGSERWPGPNQESWEQQSSQNSFLLISEPIAGAIFDNPSSILIAANVRRDGPYTRVEFWADNAKLPGGEITTSQIDPVSKNKVFGYVWKDAPAASHELKVRGIKSDGSSNESAPITIFVTSPAQFHPIGSPTTRTLQLAAVSGSPGATATIPITLTASGDENAMSFSLFFDPNQASFGSIALGNGVSGASLVVNDNQAASGQIGVVISLPTNQKISQGSQQVATLMLKLAAGLASGTVVPVKFVSNPAPKSFSDVLGGDLQVNYLDGSVTAAPPGFEADVAPRPNGNNLVNAGDITLMGRIVAGLETNLTPMEFQRADCAPRSSMGNGVINAGDLTQIARYVAGLDPQTDAGGPTGPAAGPAGSIETGSSLAKKSLGLRRLSVVNAVVALGGRVTVPINLAAQGNENALSFGLFFDPARLSYIAGSLGTGSTSASLVVNTNSLPRGRIGVVISLPVNQKLSAGTLELLRVTFNAGNSTGTVPIGLTNSPAPVSASDTLGNDLEYQSVDGTITIQEGQRLMITDFHLTGRVLEATLSGLSAGAIVVLQSSPNLRDWIPVQTNTANGTSLSISRPVNPSSGAEFLRALMK